MKEEGNDSLDCVFCEEYKEGDLLLMMTDAVYAKHAINQSEGYLNYIDAIMRLQEPANKQEALACCQHHQYIVLDEQDQYLKRQYSSTEFEGKITMLTEYYKFHANIPRVVQPKIERVLGKYHDKKREYDYKKIKKQLKEEQGISITSVQESQSDLSGSAVEKRSRYSTLLNELDDSSDEKNTGMSDSNLLKDLCKQIEKVLPSKKKDGNFQIKGAFYHDAIFQKYLKKEQMKTRQKLRLRNQERKNSITNPPKRLNLNIFSQRNRRQKEQHLLRHSKQLKKKQKDSKPVYNTNIKIQIKNAMFCTEEHFKNVNFDSESGNASKNLIRNEIFKKKIMNPLNLFDSRQPSSKFLNQIYKPSQSDSKRKININQQRTTTKESVNRSQSKDRKRSLPKQSFSQSQLKRGNNGSNSARKIIITSEIRQLSKGPSRALSTTNLKSRSLSSQSVSASASLATSAYKKHQIIAEKRPIQLISKYGSSNLKETRPEVKRSEQKMYDAISRKLTLKVG